MAKIDISDKVTWKDWVDGQVMTANDYKRERDTIITAINLSDEEMNKNQNFLLISQIMGVL